MSETARAKASSNADRVSVRRNRKPARGAGS